MFKLCDIGFEFIFKLSICEVTQTSSSGKSFFFFFWFKNENIYVLYLEELLVKSCFMSIEKDKECETCAKEN